MLDLTHQGGFKWFHLPKIKMGRNFCLLSFFSKKNVSTKRRIVLSKKSCIISLFFKIQKIRKQNRLSFSIGVKLFLLWIILYPRCPTHVLSLRKIFFFSSRGLWSLTIKGGYIILYIANKYICKPKPQYSRKKKELFFSR